MADKHMTRDEIENYIKWYEDTPNSQKFVRKALLIAHGYEERKIPKPDEGDRPTFDLFEKQSPVVTAANTKREAEPTGEHGVVSIEVGRHAHPTRPEERPNYSDAAAALHRHAVSKIVHT